MMTPLAAALLHEPGAQSRKFGVADRACFFQLIEFIDFIRGAETNHAPEFIARLLSLLRIALGHASSLEDQIRKHADVRNYYEGYDPIALTQPEMS